MNTRATFSEVDPAEIELETSAYGLRPPDYNEDILPFHMLGGRRFEILSYHLSQKIFPGNASLMIGVADKARDVVVYDSDGIIQTVIQCKNLDSR